MTSAPLLDDTNAQGFKVLQRKEESHVDYRRNVNHIGWPRARRAPESRRSESDRENHIERMWCEHASDTYIMYKERSVSPPGKQQIMYAKVEEWKTR